jgi:hypothetical protein
MCRSGYPFRLLAVIIRFFCTRFSVPPRKYAYGRVILPPLKIHSSKSGEIIDRMCAHSRLDICLALTPLGCPTVNPPICAIYESYEFLRAIRVSTVVVSRGQTVRILTHRQGINRSARYLRRPPRSIECTWRCRSRRYRSRHCTPPRSTEYTTTSPSLGLPHKLLETGFNFEHHWKYFVGGGYFFSGSYTKRTIHRAVFGARPFCYGLEPPPGSASNRRVCHRTHRFGCIGYQLDAILF